MEETGFELLNDVKLYNLGKEEEKFEKELLKIKKFEKEIKLKKLIQKKIKKS